ncbi:MAG: tRNA (guanosine(37)-N1)-methyltransferase TrmD [Candidatus Levybacteria bacterium]|nr:tRNA (guanosine(37)-N1)-methyltransferase TrmD [Candidatus Levybacteria bacterium]
MKISILSLFPEMFIGPFGHSILKRAKEKNAVTINIVNIRDFGIGKHKTVDDKPYGGGAGMVLRVDVIDKAVQSVRCNKECQEQVILLDPQGKPFIQTTARKFSKKEHLILVCGHYEGVDERVRGLVDLEISIGDYILTGGELAAMVVTDAIVRLLPGVLGKKESEKIESFEKKLLEYPQYTRPQAYKNISVPKELLLGNHKAIASWRDKQARARTKIRRPDLLRPSPS